MGDRSCGTFYIMKRDMEEAEKLFPYKPSWTDESGDSGLVEVCFDEISGGGYSLAEELEEAGIAFEWHWGAGCSYDAGFAVSTPSTGCVEVSSEGPIAVVNRDGSVDQHYIDQAMKYYEAADAFERRRKRFCSPKHHKKKGKKHAEKA